QPVRGIRAVGQVEIDGQLLADELRGPTQRVSVAQQGHGQAVGHGRDRRLDAGIRTPGIQPVGEIQETHGVAHIVIQDDVEIRGRHQPADDAVDALEHLGHLEARSGEVGDLVQALLQPFRLAQGLDPGLGLGRGDGGRDQPPRQRAPGIARGRRQRLRQACGNGDARLAFLPAFIDHRAPGPARGGFAGHEGGGMGPELPGHALDLGGTLPQPLVVPAHHHAGAGGKRLRKHARKRGQVDLARRRCERYVQHDLHLRRPLLQSSTMGKTANMPGDGKTASPPPTGTAAIMPAAPGPRTDFPRCRPGLNLMPMDASRGHGHVDDSDAAGDDVLMLAWTRGDIGAFEALYARHRERLYRFLRRQLRDPGLADEVFQDTWQRVVAAGPDWRPETAFVSWLYRIARNLVADHWRARQYRPPAPADAEERTLRLEDPDSPELQMAGFERRRDLQKALDTLPDEQREVVLLRLEQE